MLTALWYRRIARGSFIYQGRDVKLQIKESECDTWDISEQHSIWVILAVAPEQEIWTEYEQG